MHSAAAELANDPLSVWCMRHNCKILSVYNPPFHARELTALYMLPSSVQVHLAFKRLFLAINHAELQDFVGGGALYTTLSDFTGANDLP